MIRKLFLSLVLSIITLPLLVAVDETAAQAVPENGIGAVELTWTNPITYTDGTSLSLAYIYVERSNGDPVGPYTRIENLGPAMLALQTYLDEGLYDGTYYYQVIAEDSTFHRESDPSNTSQATVNIGNNLPPKPQAPTNLTATVR